MFLPIRSKNPPESFPFVTVILIVLNVAVFAATCDGWAIRRPIALSGGLSGQNFGPVSMLTSMFLHGNWLHLLGNMWFLYLFGFAVEGRLRPIKYTILYLLSGATACGLHYMMSARLDPTIPLIGASGAIMGVLAAAMFMFPHAKVTLFYAFYYRVGTTEWPMWGIGLLYLGFDLLYASIGLKTGTAHFAHLGGALGGFLIAMLLRPKRDSEYASEAKATLADVKDYGILKRMELAELHRSNPEDPLIVLHWMDRSLRETHGLKQECADAFFRLYPKMLQEFDPRQIAPVVASLAAQDMIKAREIMDLAGRLERSNDTLTALSLYEKVFSIKDAQPADFEAATFRIAMLCERMANRDRAIETYKHLLSHWPMGTFAQQAQARLQALSRPVSAPTAPRL